MITTHMRLVLGWFVLCLFALALGGCSGVLFAQQPTGSSATPAPRRTVSGAVVNSVTGAPVHRALVRINGRGSQFAFTGADGRFQIENVPEGQALITAQKPGFFDLSSTPRTFRPAHDVTIGPETADLVIKLTPQAEVQGRVLNSDGEPLESVGIQLMQQQIVNGRKQWQLSGGGSTDENGVYRIENLQPGHYVIRSESRTAFPGSQNIGPEGRLVAGVYPPQFYPNAPDLGTAQALDLKPGEQGQADFTLSAVKAFSVRGVLSGVQNGFFVECENSEGLQMPCQWRPGQTPGSFSVFQLPPGSWILRFTSNDGQGQTRFAEQLIELGTSDVKGLQLQLESLPSIPVHVVNGPDPANNLPLQLIPLKGWPGGTWFPQARDQPGSLAFRDIPPGVYTLSAQPLGTACIESVMSGNTDLTRNDLIVSPGSAPSPIEVTLSHNCAAISGSVTGQGEPVSGILLLVPESSSMQPVLLPVQPSGKFKFNSVSPGSYRLYAFDDIDGLEYANPEALRDFPSQQLELVAGQQAQVNVQLIARGDK